MMKAEDKLLQLYYQWSGYHAQTIVPLPESGSPRRYFRLSGEAGSVVGVYHLDDSENLAFVQFANHFNKQGLAVPSILAEDLPHHLYLQQDLGDSTLFELLQDETEETNKCIDYLKAAVKALPHFQMQAHVNLDYSVAYPRQAFDAQSMRWDLNYFKYHFLKLTGIVFDEQALENDFDALIQTLDQANREFFLYRDFQTRNIMIHDEQVWFIDFQGGRQGYPAYDLASLLFDAKADLSPGLRNSLYEDYLSVAKDISGFDILEFQKLYPGFVLIRKLQAMGAFGFRGLFEGKTHFLQSIPYALDNFSWILTHYSFPFKFPELQRVLLALHQSDFRKAVEEKVKTIAK